MTTELKDAIKTLCEALKGDKSEGSYYYSWQANIAMCFKDQFDNGNTMGLNFDTLHKIANDAAKNFLDMLISH